MGAERPWRPPGRLTAGTALVSQVKTNGPLFRQFGKGADVRATDTLKYHSPGENAVNENPTRVFPDMEQILANNTNAATGTCPTPPPAPTALPAATRECFSEWLPTSDWVGFLGDRTLNFRLTARDASRAAGRSASRRPRSPSRRSRARSGSRRRRSRRLIYGTTAQTITWDVAGTDVSPISVANVKISVISDQGETVIAESTPNDGSWTGAWPNVAGTHARVKVAAVGNVFFDVSDADITSIVAPTAPVGGTVPATLALTLGAPASFGPFTPGVAKEYTASTNATVISTAGDATLAVADPSTTAPGHLVNGAFSLPQPLQGLGVVKTWSAPTSNEVGPGHVQAGDRRPTTRSRTGTYSKTLTFTLSTTTP